MAGSVVVLDTSAQTVTSTVNVINPALGGHAAATFFWDITSISGTWDCAVYIDIGANRLKIAELTTQTTTGLKRLTLTADFNAVRSAVPNPTSITYTEAVAGSLTSTVYAAYGD